MHLQLSFSDADDLCQAIMLDLQTTDLLRRLAVSSTPAGYLLATLRNRGRDLVRRRGRELELLPEVSEVAAEPERRPDAAAGRLDALDKALRALSREDRKLVKMRFWQGLSIGQIAERRREPYSRVAVRLFRLRKRLAEQVATGGGGHRL